jgi:type IV pilus assembly protein PilV
MHRLKITSPSHSQRERGISLIESLIAIIIAALGILGIVGVQLRTLADTQTTVRRAQAIRLIEDLSERMKVNPNALSAIDNYVVNSYTCPALPSAPPAPGTCASTPSGCKQSEQAGYDIAVWRQSVCRSLPSGQLQTFIPNDTARRQLGVMIAWRENERDDDDTYKNPINAITGSGGGTTCPSGYTCHLQYIPVPARCAPYKPDSSAAKYYCSGAK